MFKYQISDPTERSDDHPIFYLFTKLLLYVAIFSISSYIILGNSNRDFLVLPSQGRKHATILRNNTNHRSNSKEPQTESLDSRGVANGPIGLPTNIPQSFHQDPNFLESRRNIEASGEPLDIFLGDNDKRRRWANRIIRSFVSRRSTVADASQIGRAWLDDRKKSIQQSNGQTRNLKASELRRHLLIPQFGAGSSPDSERRLIYVPGLDPDFINALVETATSHQREPLRSAIAKHLDYEASIGILKPLTGNAFSCLEFHLPYMILRPHNEAKHSKWLKNRNHVKPWLDLMFLNMTDIDGQPCRYKIHEAHVSIVLCEQRRGWTGWSFVDNDFGYSIDDGTSENDEAHEIRDDSGGEDENADEEPSLDLFFSDGKLDRGDNLPSGSGIIWDSHEYGLWVFECRVRHIQEESEYLVKTIQESVDNWRSKHSILLTSNLMSKNMDNPKSLYNWTVLTTKLLRELKHCLLRKIEAWGRFDRPEGDIESLRDHSGPYHKRTLMSIRKSYYGLEDLVKILNDLEDLCEESKKTLSLYMDLDSGAQNRDANLSIREAHELNVRSIQLASRSLEIAKVTSEITQTAFLMSLFIASIGLTFAYFSTENDAIFGAERNLRSFTLCFFSLSIVLFLLLFLVSPHYRSLILKRTQHLLQLNQSISHGDVQLDDLGQIPLYNGQHSMR